MKKVKSAQLKDKDNHTSCECGNKTIYEYVWTDVNGESQSCPLCMVNWQSLQIKAMKELLYQLSHKSKEETAQAINQKYAEIMLCELEDIIDSKFLEPV